MKKTVIAMAALIIVSCTEEPENDTTEENLDTLVITHEVMIGDENIYSDYGFAIVSDICLGPDGSCFCRGPDAGGSKKVFKLRRVEW